MTKQACLVAAALCVSLGSFGASAVPILTAGIAPVPLQDDFEKPLVPDPPGWVDYTSNMTLKWATAAALFQGTAQYQQDLPGNVAPNAYWIPISSGPVPGPQLLSIDAPKSNLGVFYYDPVIWGPQFTQAMAGIISVGSGPNDVAGTGTTAIRFAVPQTVIGFDVLDWQGVIPGTGANSIFTVGFFDDTGAQIDQLVTTLPIAPYSTWTLASSVPFRGVIFESTDNAGFSLDNLRYAPLPGTLPLMVIGTLGFALIRRMRRPSVAQ